MDQFPLSTDTSPIRLESLAGESTDIPANIWALVRWSASMFGQWIPAGTQPPSEWPASEQWDGGYEIPAGQMVAAGDAGALAAGLRHAAGAMAALALIPRGEKEAVLRDVLSPIAADRVIPVVEKYGPGQSPGRDLRLHVALEGYAEFFSKGGFRIVEGKVIS